MGALKPGSQITNELLLLRRLGAGGMGTVWLARHAKLETEVVVKFLSESLVADADACARFSREVTATVHVRSPHVVQMLDHGITEGGIPYIVMELLEGSDLAKVMKQGQLRPDEVQHVIEGVAAALTKAHERGIVHRDIKPANVFLCTGNPRPFVKLVDFGIAKRLEDETMTATNALLGTPAYMSPEQMAGTGAIDQRTDLWALGVLAYHMLTGKPPFRGAHIANIAHSILNEDTPRITALRPDLPPALDFWIERALSRDPNERFPTAREMADTLADALGDLAYSTTRKLGGSGERPLIPLAGGSGPILPVGTGPFPQASTGPYPHAGSGASPVVVQQTPSGPIVHSHPHAQPMPSFDADGTTFGPSAITHNPYTASTRRMKWGVMVVAAVGVLLIAGAFQVGYRLRHDPPILPATTPPTEVSPRPTAAPTLTGTVIGASPATLPLPASGTAAPTAAPAGTPPNATAAATAPPRPPSPGRRTAPGAPRPAGKKGHGGEDDIGF